MYHYLKQSLKMFSLVLSFNQGSLYRTPVTLISLSYFSVSRKVFGRVLNKGFRISVSYAGAKYSYVLRKPSDISALIEVYVDREYDWKLESDPKVIVDLGAHFGDTTLYYAARYPEAKIIAVEPVKANLERLCENTAGMKNISVVHAAIGDVAGEVDISLSESSLGHSIAERTSGAVTETVKQITIEQLLLDNNHSKADLIKFDIEGAEEFMFKSGKLPELGCNYIGEVHLDLISMNEAQVADSFKEFSVEKVILNERRYILQASLG